MLWPWRGPAETYEEAKKETDEGRGCERRSGLQASKGGIRLHQPAPDLPTIYYLVLQEVQACSLQTESSPVALCRNISLMSARLKGSVGGRADLKHMFF